MKIDVTYWGEGVKGMQAPARLGQAADSGGMHAVPLFS